MEFKCSKQTFFLCLLIFAAALPAVFLRELSPINELNYIAAAQDAIDHNRFFSFFEDGKPFTQTPPLYMWICMVAILFDGLPTSSIMLFLNVFSLIGIILLLDRNLGGMLRSNYRNKAAVMIVSMPFMMISPVSTTGSCSIIKSSARCFIKQIEATTKSENKTIG